MTKTRVEGLHQVSFEEHGSTIEIIFQPLSHTFLRRFFHSTARPGHPPTFDAVVLESSNSRSQTALTFLVLEGRLAERLF